MTRRHTGVILIGVAILCLLTEHVARAEAPRPESDPAGGPGSYNLDNVSITLERTECFGPCPVYRVTVSGHGDVLYEGLKFVDAIGIHQSTIAVDDVVGLLNEFLRVRFFDVLDKYEGQQFVQLEGDRLIMYRQTVSCHSSTILTLRLGDHEKSVVLYDNYPSDLKSLAETVDSAVNTKQWVGPDK